MKFIKEYTYLTLRHLEYLLVLICSIEKYPFLKSNCCLFILMQPWEAGQFLNSSSQVLQPHVNGESLKPKVQDNGVIYQFDGESATPWWQRKNARITEIEHEDELKARPNVARTNEQPIQRTWVPPQPPPVAMPEAAEAIRQPKSSVQQEQVAEDQSVSLSTAVTDELQRITKVSESGSAVEVL